MKNLGISNSLGKQLDTDLTDLKNQKETWATLSISKKIEILDQIKKKFLAMMNEWVVNFIYNFGLGVKF